MGGGANRAQFGRFNSSKPHLLSLVKLDVIFKNKLYFIVTITIFLVTWVMGS